jgi:S1-C subfamily serine protease
MSTVTAWVNGVSYRAEVVATHPAHDLAILGLRAPDLLLKPVELADTARELAGGESLVILAGPSQPRNATGDPAGRIPIPGAFRERVTLRLPNGNTGDLLKMDARVERGDSGSPVIRVKDGKVVGILSSRELPDTAGVSHFAYAVPVEELHPWLESASAPPLRRDDEEFYLLDLPMR